MNSVWLLTWLLLWALEELVEWGGLGFFSTCAHLSSWLFYAWPHWTLASSTVDWEKKVHVLLDEIASFPLYNQTLPALSSSISFSWFSNFFQIYYLISYMVKPEGRQIRWDNCVMRRNPGRQGGKGSTYVDRLNISESYGMWERRGHRFPGLGLQDWWHVGGWIAGREGLSDWISQSNE